MLVCLRVTPEQNASTNNVGLLRLNADAQQLFQDLGSALLPLRQAHDLGSKKPWGPFFMVIFYRFANQKVRGKPKLYPQKGELEDFVRGIAISSPKEASPARPLAGTNQWRSMDQLY